MRFDFPPGSAAQAAVGTQRPEVGLRLRALQITSQQGAPQGYAQQAMFIATYSVLVQVLVFVRCVWEDLHLLIGLM